MPHASPAAQRRLNDNTARGTAGALVLGAPVLHAGSGSTATAPVTQGAEDALAEQAIGVGAVLGVLEKVGMSDLAGRPGADILWAGESEGDGGEVVDPARRGVAIDHRDGPRG